MSREHFDDNCEGCRPALLNAKTGLAEPADSPLMQAVMRVWGTTAVEERLAWHSFTCGNDQSPAVMRYVVPLMERMKAAVSEVPCGTKKN